MADFGLAAKIGSGNAMPGAQQQDPQNRMMQMMQLQQLQQNMMLAREQNAREAALAPLREGQLRASTQADEALTPGRQAQSKVYQLALGEKETEQRTYKGFLDVMDRMAKGTFNPADPAAFRDLPTAVRLNVQDQLAKSSVTAAAAKKAGIELGGVERAVTYDMLSRAGVGITGPREFQSFRNKIVKVTPEADEFLPRSYNPRTAQDLRDFVGSQVANIEKIGDVPYLRVGSSPFAQELTVVPAGAGRPTQSQTGQPFGYNTVSLPAGVQPPTRAQIGSTALTEPALGANADAETFNAARAAGAVTPPYTPPGAVPSGVPGQRLPVAGGPVPASQAAVQQAGARTLATESAQAAVKRQGEDVKKQEGRQSVQDTLSGMIDAYKNLGSLGELQRADMSIPKRLSIAAQARLPGDIATAVNFDAGSELTTINNLRQSLIPVLTEVMGSKAVDAARESEAILASLTSGGQSPASIARTLTNFSKKYGLGVTFKPEDLAYTPPAGAAGSARGRPAPAPARAPTNAPVSVDDLLKKYNAGAGQ